MSQTHRPRTAERPGRHDRPDVVLAGPVFWDLVLTGLPRFPGNGEEIRAATMATAPGGAANLAIAAARLGLRTALATAVGEDGPGRFCRDVLEAEHVDMSASQVWAGWTTPVTVSITHDGDRRMLTHQTGRPVAADELLAATPTPRAALVDLDDMHRGDGRSWTRRAAAEGCLVVADIGFDETGRWHRDVLDELAYCSVFLPSAVEAMGLTGTTTPREAARALAGRVPVAVVTDGSRGAWAVDSAQGVEIRVDAVPVAAQKVVDATGAGDVFDAAYTWAALAGWPLGRRLDLASLCSALAVQRLTGSLGAPGWAEIGQWWRGLGESPTDMALTRRYAFLDDCAAGLLDAPAARPAPTSVPWDLPGTPNAV